MPPVRLGHHYIDLARGWLYHGNRQKALETLLAARRAATLCDRPIDGLRTQVREVETTALLRLGRYRPLPSGHGGHAFPRPSRRAADDIAPRFPDRMAPDMADP
ncbi:hypothetical protein AB0K21_23020 [Streptosporangium sp. NPDC049248]|uniref:hypothetical protein n=1 Tax=Streptosporangium sp. NPDC049248 TaxID=3155651 RepID=UPI00343D973D